MKKNIEQALNAQLNLEFESAYIYLAMSTYFEGEGLSGIAHWMREQANEERDHMRRYYDYLISRARTPVFEAVPKPLLPWKHTLQFFEAALKHETKVSKAINNIVDLSIKEKDHPTFHFLQWFVSEQVEEEATFRKVLDHLKLLGQDSRSLYFLDQELGRRSLEA